MKKKRSDVSMQLTDQDCQVTPLPGEVSPEHSRSKSLHFAIVEKLRMEAIQRTLSVKPPSTKK